jgi:hypothetical protein
LAYLSDIGKDLNRENIERMYSILGQKQAKHNSYQAMIKAEKMGCSIEEIATIGDPERIRKRLLDANQGTIEDTLQKIKKEAGYMKKPRYRLMKYSSLLATAETERDFELLAAMEVIEDMRKKINKTRRENAKRKIPVDLENFLSPNGSKILTTLYEERKSDHNNMSAHILNEKTDIPIAQTYRTLKILEKEGHIEVIGRRLTEKGKRENMYRITIRGIKIKEHVDHLNRLRDEFILELNNNKQ